MSFERIRYYPCGDRAVLLEFGENIDLETNLKVQNAFHCLQNNAGPAVLEAVPALRSLLVYYDGRLMDYKAIVAHLERTIGGSEARKKTGKRVVIPVLYGGDSGPDLPYVAGRHGLTEDEVVRLHSDTVYVNSMFGFDPGFVVLIGLPEILQTPRKDNPRLKVPAGSVGIGAAQTGVYSFERAGGWQIIGRTPLKLFHFTGKTEVIADIGDEVVFEPISEKRYDEIHLASENRIRDREEKETDPESAAMTTNNG